MVSVSSLVTGTYVKHTCCTMIASVVSDAIHAGAVLEKRKKIQQHWIYLFTTAVIMWTIPRRFYDHIHDVMIICMMLWSYAWFHYILKKMHSSAHIDIVLLMKNNAVMLTHSSIYEGMKVRYFRCAKLDFRWRFGGLLIMKEYYYDGENIIWLYLFEWWRLVLIALAAR